MNRVFGKVFIVNFIGLILGGIGLSAAVQPDYYLTVIQEEETPLAPTIPRSGTDSYFVWTLAIMLLMAAVAFATLYICQCIKYREVYFQMIRNANGEPEKFKRAGWNLVRLKELVYETENRIVKMME